MYIQKIDITNIRSIEKLEWSVNKGKEAGWHVVIGDNGSGKSTFLRAIALALVGPLEAAALRQDWNTWLGQEYTEGSVYLGVYADKKVDKFSRSGNIPKSNLFPIGITLQRQGDTTRIEKTSGVHQDPDRHLWGNGAGWFSTSFGPFRRFTGSDKEYERIFSANPKLAAHLSVFGENIALTECIIWLQQLWTKKLERQFKQPEKQPIRTLLDDIIDFVNQEDFLPHATKIKDVSSEGVWFIDGNGNTIAVEELSDGYRSILSMSFEIIRQIARIYGEESIFAPGDTSKIIPPGVILIDEVDAHLHPTWQRTIGPWFRKHFPSMQFIVTTHSPFICQAATDGSVYRLPKPGSYETGRMITGIELDRLLYGNVLDAYGTNVFGSNIARSEESMRKLERLADLNLKELNGQLTTKESVEQDLLRSTLPTSAHQTRNPS